MRPLPDLLAAAERADWAPPRTLTAVILPEEKLRGALVSLDDRTLRAGEDVPGLDAASDLLVLLVPDAEGRSRPALLRSLDGRDAVVGPARPWAEAAASYARACRALRLGLTAEGSEPLDTERRLADLVLRADGEALADLRAAVLAPLDDLSPARARSSSRPCGRGCCTRGGGTRWRPSCSCTRRPCGTG